MISPGNRREHLTLRHLPRNCVQAGRLARVSTTQKGLPRA